MPRKFKPKKNKKIPNYPIETVKIDSVGSLGDGLVMSGVDRLYIPFALKAEVLKIKRVFKRSDGFECKIVEIIQKSKDRATPVCNHYEKCGGCNLQHMNAIAQRDFKRNIIQTAFKNRAIMHKVSDPIMTGGLRIRARFAVKKVGKKFIGGFYKQKSNVIEPISDCHIIHPLVFQTFKDFLNIIDNFSNATFFDFHITTIDNKCEVVIYPDSNFKLSLTQREILSDAITQFNLSAIYIYSDGHIEPVCVKENLQLKLNGVLIQLPPATFLQPSVEGREILTKKILDALGSKFTELKTIRVADLFCGFGGFSIPISTVCRVDCFDSCARSIASLHKCSAQLSKLTAFQRDLEILPLRQEELQNYNCVILNPPRFGAKTQVNFLKDASLDLIIYISCNHVSFVKDCLVLQEGGYTLKSTLPIDQFISSTHIECISIFERARDIS